MATKVKEGFVRLTSGKKFVDVPTTENLPFSVLSKLRLAEKTIRDEDELSTERAFVVLNYWVSLPGGEWIEDTPAAEFGELLNQYFGAADDEAKKED